MKILIFFKNLFIGFVGGILGALGGAQNSNNLFRGLGIPLLITLIAFVTMRHWMVLSIMSLMAILSIGYGQPCPYSGDDGAPLGRFYYWLFRGNAFWSNVLTRGTIAFLSCLTFLSIPLLKGNWIMYGIGSIITIAVFALLSWRTLGGITLFNRYLTLSEIIPYSVLTAFGMFLIF